MSMILPFLFMLSTSLKMPGDLYQIPMRWIPSNLTTQNYTKAFTKIILPLAGPALATLAIFGLKGAWNDNFGPLISIISPDKFNIQQMIAATQNAYSGEPGVLMAAALVALLPLLLLFSWPSATSSREWHPRG